MPMQYKGYEGPIYESKKRFWAGNADLYLASPHRSPRAVAKHGADRRNSCEACKTWTNECKCDIYDDPTPFTDCAIGTTIDIEGNQSRVYLGATIQESNVASDAIRTDGRFPVTAASRAFMLVGRRLMTTVTLAAPCSDPHAAADDNKQTGFP
jgi:hypothetical protein